MFTLERKVVPILVGTLTIRKTYILLDTGTSINRERGKVAL